MPLNAVLQGSETYSYWIPSANPRALHVPQLGAEGQLVHTMALCTVVSGWQEALPTPCSAQQWEEEAVAAVAKFGSASLFGA